MDVGPPSSAPAVLPGVRSAVAARSAAASEALAASVASARVWGGAKLDKRGRDLSRVHKRYTAAEDALIRAGVAGWASSGRRQAAPCWTQIAKQLPGRKPHEIRARGKRLGIWKRGTTTVASVASEAWAVDAADAADAADAGAASPCQPTVRPRKRKATAAAESSDSGSLLGSPVARRREASPAAGPVAAIAAAGLDELMLSLPPERRPSSPQPSQPQSQPPQPPPQQQPPPQSQPPPPQQQQQPPPQPPQPSKPQPRSPSAGRGDAAMASMAAAAEAAMAEAAAQPSSPRLARPRPSSPRLAGYPARPGSQRRKRGW